MSEKEEWARWLDRAHTIEAAEQQASSPKLNTCQCSTPGRALAWSSALPELALEGDMEPAHAAEAVSHSLAVRS
jgi:hypothetical protein